MHAAQGILTTRGGMTSHAAVVARGMGRPCVAGAGELRIDPVKRIMRVRDISTELPHAPAHLDCCLEIPIALRAHRFCVESGNFGARQKRRSFRGENERLMPSLGQSRREEENLPLTAAPITS